jgi:hypothetical protein
VKYLDNLDKESLSLKEELLRICWYMRGGLSYDDAFLLDYQEREIIGKIIKDNMETTKKSGLPFF